ncbi:MAG TPA: STAS domain-containing protein [Bryobacteraceae bacterium]|jgi:anti-sigma B factor antagonist|nr:STAS domain-containing protein [Bryobacteraceae bacterium]
MPIGIEQREIEEVLVVDLSGRLVAGPEAAELRRTFEELKEQRKNRVVLNLKEIDYIDSTGLGTLVIGHSVAFDTGGAMKLLNLSRRSAQLLILTKLSTVFEMFDDEQSAINSFFPDREIKSFDVLDFVRNHSDKEDDDDPNGI